MYLTWTCNALFPWQHHTSAGHTHVLQGAALVSIIPNLNMDMYSLKRQEAGFEALLRAVAEVLLKHVDPDTVAYCAGTLVHCTQHGPQAIQVSPPPTPLWSLWSLSPPKCCSSFRNAVCQNELHQPFAIVEDLHGLPHKQHQLDQSLLVLL